MNKQEFKKNKSIIEKFDSFVELFKNRKFSEIKKFNIVDLKKDDKFYFDFRYILSVLDFGNKKKNYKSENDFLYYDYLSDVIIKYDIDNYFLFIKKLSKIKRGEYLLNKLVKYLKFKNYFGDKNFIYENLELSSRLGTLRTFLFWEGIYKKHHEKCIISNQLFLSSLNNSDDRIFKNILKKNNYYKIDDKKNHFYFEISTSLFCNVIPKKYVLRRLKYLSNYFDFEKNLNFLISNVTYSNIFFKILKFYYTKRVLLSKFSSIVNIMIFNDELENFDKLYNMLHTKFEKYHLTLTFITGILKYKQDKILYINNLCIKDIEIDNIDILQEYSLDFLNYMESNFDFVSIKLIKNILFKLKELGFVDNYLLTKYSKIKLNSNLHWYSFIFNLLPYSNYLPIKNENNILIHFNRLMFNFKIYIKRIKNIKILTRKTYYYKLLNEVKTFKPNPNKKILSNGSKNFILGKQSFNYQPPYHLHFNELNKFNHFLLREKADGVMVKRLPIDTTPSCDGIKNHRIKAEYIEDLDLYLIFDIEIPNMSIKDRYRFLRSYHPTTNNENLKMISNFENLKYEIRRERERFNNFLKKDYDCYRWYPKASWEVYNVKDNFRRSIIENVILEKEKDFICNNGNYTNDGLILVPLNGLNEIKIKPKSLMTIDLLCRNGKWTDSDNNDWSNIIVNSSDEFNNLIVRCYPIGKGLYDPRDIRFDKKSPNNYKIIIENIKFYENNWNNSNIENRYYDKMRENSDWKRIVKNQNDNLIKMIELLSPLDNSRWLDLGCGNGKIFNIVRKKNPQSYLGIDNDLNVILNCIHRFDKIINKRLRLNTNFISTDLNYDWNNGNNNWYKINFDVKMDYVISNFSMMYFCCDNFWKNLNRITKNGTKMILNVVNDKSSKKINFNDSYMFKEGDKVRYYFSNVHEKEKEENFISDNMLNKYFKKYNWSVKNKLIPNGNFESYYTWYIIEKY